MSDEEYESEEEEMLARAKRVREALQSSRRKRIESLYDEFPELWELLVIDLNDGGQGAGFGLASSLGINTTLLNKFIKQKKPIDMRDARMVADRITTYLRSIQPSGNSPRVKRHPPEPPEIKQEASPIVVKAIEWKVVIRSDALQAKINEAIRLIGEVIEHATTSNLPPRERALTALERAQLIAVLETALSMLKAPMIEKGLLKKAGGMVKRAAEKAAEKQVEIAFSTAGGALAGAFFELVRHF